jgi:hypothetical protein
MACLLIVVITWLLVWANMATVSTLNRRHAKAGWWLIFAVAWAAGAGIGVWSGFFLEYQATPTLRVFGFPISAAFFHYEGPPGQEKWIDFIMPAPILFAGSNIFILGMIAACPVGLAFWLWSVHRGHR